MEEAVLGALLVDKRAMDKVTDILGKNPDVSPFYREEHNNIYKAVIALSEEGEPVDILTVSNKLRSAGLLDASGGDYYLVQLSQKVSSSAHVEYHAQIVYQKYIQRELIKISADMIDRSYDETTDVFDLLDDAQQTLFDISNNNFNNDIARAETLVHQAIKQIEELSKHEGDYSGLPSGFSAVDNVTSGWQKSDLIIIAARPGMGKTAFVVSMAMNMAIKHEVPVALFSLEMSAVQLMTRMISSETGIPAQKLRKANLSKDEWEILTSKVKNLESSPIFIDDTPALSISDLRSKVRQLVKERKVKIIVIDYLQLMTAGKQAGNREQEISIISRSLKAIAKEYNIPVIALSQLSRAVETQTGSKRPMLSHLRESGAIEQDADIVSFIYRPEYYGITEWDDDQHTPTAGQAEFIIAKHRNGSTENVRLKFTPQLAQFSDLDGHNPFATNSFAGNPFADDNDVLDSRINVRGVSAGDAFDIVDNNIIQSNINNNDSEVPF